MKSVTTLFLILFAFAFFSSASEGNPVNDDRTKAISLFHNGDYAQALPIFRKLAEESPADALLKYFTGACMMETAIHTSETEIYLLLAGSEDVPAKVFYYLGKFYHHKEEWDNAIRYYNRFRNNTTKEETELVSLAQLMEEVYAQQKPGTKIAQQPQVLETIHPEPTESHPALGPPILTAESSDYPPSDILKESERREEAGAPNLLTNIQFQVNALVTYWLSEQFKINEAREAWERGKEKETEVALITDSLRSLRIDYQSAGSALVRNQLASTIVPLERAALIAKADAEKHFSLARSLEAAWWENAGSEAYALLNAENEALLQANDSIVSIAIHQAFPEIGEEELEEEEFDTNADTEDQEVIVYKVQLGSFTGRVPARTQTLFDQIARVRPVETFRNENNATIYTTGNLRSFEDALALQNQIRIEGIKDAFVIAIKDGKRISLPEAK